MEKALKVQRGEEQLVSASEIQLEFRGKNPQDISFICPLCRQPLLPAAMSPGNKQSPHFRHERNNERAHECELYASSYGYSATYQRMPMPMFIRRSRSRRGTFIVEAGFRNLDQSKLDTLEHEGAVVSIVQRKYKVTSQRFSTGLTKLPFEEVSLNCRSTVRLVGSSLDLDSTWGYPEDARHAMVFTRDSDTEQGKRLNLGDIIPFETNLFLLAPEKESNRIRFAFENARRVGVAGKHASTFGLAVFEVRLTKDDSRWKQGKDYLEECGFTVNDSGNVPELIWPPSLISGGDLLPLFQRAQCVFTADMRSSENDCLYVHTNTDTAGRVRTVHLCRSDNENRGFSILENTAKLSFVTTRDWVLSTALLLHPSDFVIDKLLHELTLEPQVSFDSERWNLELMCPSEVWCYEKGKSIRKLTGGNTFFSFEENSLDKLQVRRRLNASLDYLIIFEKTFDSRASSTGGRATIAAGKNSMAPGVPKDTAFAMARRNRELKHRSGLDMQRALRRKAENNHG